MLLTVSKRLEFSASRRLFSPRLTNAENFAAFGPETSAQYGTGRNYVAFFVFAGEVNQATGMLMNISEIKSRVEKTLRDHFDHKFLNEDNPAFTDLPPTAENIAHQLFQRVAPLFVDVQARLAACHLTESRERSATFYATQILESNYWFEFSAARQTMSPHLGTKENQEFFGIASSPFGHGHHYRGRLTFCADQPTVATPVVRHDDIHRCVESIRAELDHKSLNHEVSGLKDRPITTESLAQYVYDRVRATLPIHRVRLHERDDFFAEHWGSQKCFLGMRRAFSAVHRLNAGELSSEENRDLYGKCNNPRGHGHEYLTEATIGGDYDERSGTLYNFVQMQNGIDEALQPWQDKHLDLEAEEFRQSPSSGENIVCALWPKLNSRLNNRLVRLRLWETANNRFTLRNGGTRSAASQDYGT